MFGVSKRSRQLFGCALAAMSLLFTYRAKGEDTVPQSLYNGLRWRLVGPFRGGRAEAATGISGDPLTYYFGAVAGGVWKTVNGGATWTPITDKQGIYSIGALAVDPTNPNVIYVGTGEPCLRNDISSGDGIYKSTDAGKTWTNMGLHDTQHIADILVDPHDPNIVFVAAVGHAFGPNEERGIFRSKDGGKTWDKVLYVDDKTGATDLAQDPHNPQVLFAAMYEVRRTAYSMISGGPGSGLYKSTDGGTTWKHLQGGGLPSGVLGRIGVTVSGADSNRVYAMIESKENAIYRSNDGGATWSMVNNDPIWVRPWYGNHIFADPKNVDTVFVLDLGTMRSTDGGRTFATLPVPHSDDHHLWIDPADPKRMIEADDGGVSISQDGGATWSPENNQPTAQFYHVSADNEFNYRIYGSQQDSGSVGILSRSDSGSIGDREWHGVGGGESGYDWPDPRDSNIVYGGDHNGHFTRYDARTGQVQDIAPWFGARAHVPAELKHRFNWTSPMQVSPHDPSVLYIGGEVVFKSTSGGMSWTAISPDLTRNDKSKQQSSPTPLTPDNSSSEYYDTVFAIAESPVQKNLIWAGSDDGLVHLTRDGKTWNKVTPPQLPEWACVDLIEPSPYDAGTAYLAADLHFSDDFRPMILKTADFGKTWTEIIHGIPENDYVHSVRADPVRKGLLYAGTESGIYVSFDDGANWQSLQLNLPHTPVFDTATHGNDLIAATHGRAFWILDDITSLRQTKEQISSESAYLYTPTLAVREHGGGGFGGGRSGGPGGQNPPRGAVIDYYLKAAPSDPVILDILDSHGQVLHHVTSAEAKNEQSPAGGSERGRNRRPGGESALRANEGMNRYVWNLRVDGPEPVPGLFILETQSGGPAIPPGQYQVRLTASGKQYAAPLEVKMDPRVRTSQADLLKQYELALKLRDRVTDVHQTVLQIREARAALESARNGADANKVQAIDAVEQKMAAVESELTQVKSTNLSAALVYPIMLDAQYADLGNVVESSDSAPPAQVYDVFKEYDRRREDLAAKWKALQPEVAELEGSRPVQSGSLR